MSQKNHLRTRKPTIPKKPRENTVVISVRVPEFMAFILKCHANETGRESASEVLKFWIANYCVSTYAEWKQETGKELSPLENEVLKLNSGLYPRAENFANAMIDLEERGLLKNAEDPFRLQPHNEGKPKLALISGKDV